MCRCWRNLHLHSFQCPKSLPPADLLAVLLAPPLMLQCRRSASSSFPRCSAAPSPCHLPAQRVAAAAAGRREVTCTWASGELASLCAYLLNACVHTMANRIMPGC